MRNKKTDQDLDKELFKTAMQGVRPLKDNNSINPTNQRRKNYHSETPLSDKKPKSILSDHEYLDALSSADQLSFTRSGLQQRLLRQLRRGQLPIEANLDLHGHTVEQARIAITNFLTWANQQRLRMVIIIHGKGKPGSKPILKNKLNHWLREFKQILAFHSAQAKDGGAGAVYVLLKRSQIDKK